MKSRLTVTYQIDDPVLAARELAEGIGTDFALGKNSAAILFCYSDAEPAALVEHLAAVLPFDLIGCTTIASMDHKEGFHPLAATLLVLTADDCEFSVGVSDAITPDNVTDQIRLAYARATANGKAPGLVLALPPYQLEVMLDVYPDTFNEIAPGIPFVGGLPSYNADGDENLTFHAGSVHADRLVLLSISGDIRPVFSVQTVTDSPLKRKRKVTASKGNLISRVGDQTFTEYLAEFGLPVEKLASGNNTVTFVANPLLLEHSGPGKDEHYAFLRTLHEIDLERGTGTAIGRIPEDATISICPMDREEIADAAVQGIGALTEKMDAVGDSYHFSTVLAISCIGRHLLMTPNNSVEVDRLLAGLPPALSLSGFYSYGEIGPLPGRGEGSVNFAHNESMVLCAF